MIDLEISNGVHVHPSAYQFLFYSLVLKNSLLFPPPIRKTGSLVAVVVLQLGNGKRLTKAGNKMCRNKSDQILMVKLAVRYPAQFENKLSRANYLVSLLSMILNAIEIRKNLLTTLKKSCSKEVPPVSKGNTSTYRIQSSLSNHFKATLKLQGTLKTKYI